VQQLQNSGASADKDRKKLEDEATALRRQLEGEKDRAGKAAQEAEAKMKAAAKQVLRCAGCGVRVWCGG
jgi:hypothetical protein